MRALPPFLRAAPNYCYGIPSRDGRTIPLGIFSRKSLSQYVDADYIFDKTRQGFAYFEEKFDYPYPFEKYDQLFVPEFNAGAMENAGAITFTETYVFRSKVTDAVKERLLASSDSRLTSDGVIVIKAQTFRTQAQNREDALQRLRQFIEQACRIRPPRKATRPTLASKLRRVDAKTKQGKIKSLRGRPRSDD